MQKYKILYERKKLLPDGTSVYRIQALHDFGDIKEGTIGGYVASCNNLSHRGLCWVADDAIATEFSFVQKDALLSGNAKLSGFAWIGGKVHVTDHAELTDYTSAYDNAFIGGFARLCEGASVFENGHVETKYQRDFMTMRGLTTVRGNARLLDHAAMYDKSLLDGDAILRGNAALRENAHLGDLSIAEQWSRISGDAFVCRHVRIAGHTHVTGDATIDGHVMIDGKSYVTCKVRLGGRQHYRNVTFSGDLILF